MPDRVVDPVSAEDGARAERSQYRAVAKRLLHNPRAPLAWSTGFSLLAYFLTSKYVAHEAGVSGVAVLGIVMAIANVLALFGDVNVGVEMLRRIAENLGTANDATLERQLIAATRRITYLVSATLVAIVAGLSGWLGSEVDLKWYEVVLAASAGAATIAAQQELNVLSGRGNTRRLALTASARSLTVLITLVVILLARDSIPVAYSASMWLGLVTALVVSRSRGPVQRVVVPRSLYLELLRVGRLTTATLAAYTGVLLAMPVPLAALAGRNLTGWFRATTLLSGSLVQFFNSSIRYEYFPRLSRMTDEGAAQRAVRLEIRLMVGAMAVFALVLIPIRSIALSLSFSSDFRDAATLLSWVLAADLVRCSVAVVGYSMYARCGVGWLLAIEAIGGVSLAGLMLWAALNGPTSTTLGMAYLGAHLLAAFGAILISRKRLFERLPKFEMLLVGTSLAFIGASSAAATVSGWLSAAVAAAGIVTCITVVRGARLAK